MRKSGVLLPRERADEDNGRVSYGVSTGDLKIDSRGKCSQGVERTLHEG